jgi:hypothetical protein
MRAEIFHAQNFSAFAFIGVHRIGFPDYRSALESERCVYAAAAEVGAVLPPEGGVPEEPTRCTFIARFQKSP